MVETSKQIHSIQIFGFVLASKVHTTLILKHSVGIAKIENFDISSSSYKMSQTFFILLFKRRRLFQFCLLCKQGRKQFPCYLSCKMIFSS